MLPPSLGPKLLPWSELESLRVVQVPHKQTDSQTLWEVTREHLGADPGGPREMTASSASLVPRWVCWGAAPVESVCAPELVPRHGKSWREFGVLGLQSAPCI